jgi:hypothetical protein
MRLLMCRNGSRMSSEYQVRIDLALLERQNPVGIKLTNSNSFLLILNQFIRYAFGYGTYLCKF